MNRDHLVYVTNAVLACAAAAVLLAPKFAYSVQLETAPSSKNSLSSPISPSSANSADTKNTVTGNPVEDRITLPVTPKPKTIGRPSLQPMKNQVALQTEIDGLKATVNKFNANSTARNSPTVALQKRQAANAAWVLGLLYANGLGVDVDYSEAHLRFKQAHRLGEPLAVAGLAWCEIQGCETLPSAQAARVWIAQLRASKPARAIFLDWLVEQTFLPLQANSAKSAASIDKLVLQRRQLLLNAAKTQDVQALIELGFDAVANERVKEAYTYFSAASPYSAVAAQNAVLIQTRQNDKQVTCQIPGGADLPDTVLLSTAQALHRGNGGMSGCQVNYAEAIRLYNLAANKGNVSAKRMLALIYSKPDANGNLNISWMQQLANLDAANLSLSLDGASLAPMLKRETTPLYDLIPLNLRQLSNKN
jgi:uncharacterized protein